MPQEMIPKEIGVEEISYFYDQMVRSNLTQLEIETPNGKIVLERRKPEDKGGHLLRRSSDFGVPGGVITAAPAQVQQSVPQQAPAPAGQTINSPIIGTFYRAPSPQAAPFAKEGDTINAGGNLCIVEAMKVMNQIKAEYRCKIVKILGENGKSVTKGQPLFEVEPA